jgi:hypothetical protein
VIGELGIQAFNSKIMTIIHKEKNGETIYKALGLHAAISKLNTSLQEMNEPRRKRTGYRPLMS